MSNFTVHEIPTSEIKFFVKRSRTEAGFERLKESIRQVGLTVPIQVRKIKDPKFKYELIAGQGRLQAFRELRIPTIPAIIVDVSEQEIAGRFLAENVMRKRIPWLEKARLMKGEFDAGTPAAEIAKKFAMTVPHVEKCLLIVNRASNNVDIDGLTTEEAFTLTTLPAQGQEIVMQTLKEEGLDSTQIGKIVEKARNLAAENQPLSVSALQASLKGTTEELRKVRESLKLRRLHWSLGPENLRTLLSNRKFKAALDAKGINYSKFQA